MSLMGSIESLFQTYGSGQVIFLAWLCFLALAALVFVVLVTMGVPHRGRGPMRQSSDQQLTFCRLFFTMQRPQEGEESRERQRHIPGKR